MIKWSANARAHTHTKKNGVAQSILEKLKPSGAVLVLFFYFLNQRIRIRLDTAIVFHSIFVVIVIARLLATLVRSIECNLFWLLLRIYWKSLIMQSLIQFQYL